MAIDKNQHYVPQFYLRYFSNDGKNIGIYLLDEKKLIKQGPIKNQASENYFYVKEKAEESEQNLACLERKIKETFDRIAKSNGMLVNLNSEEEDALLVAVALQFCRTKSAAKLLDALVEKMSKVVSRRDFNLGLTEEDLANIVIKVNHAPAFNMAHAWIPTINALADLRYKFVSVKDNTYFKLMTSDNPVAIFNPFYERIGVGSIGLASKGLVVFMPLSPFCGIMYYDSQTYKMGNKKGTYVEIGNDEITQLNRITALNADKCTYCMPFTISTQRFVDINKAIVRFREYEKIDSISSDMSIIGMSHKLPSCKAKVSFLKELDKAKGIKSIDDLKRMKVSIYRNI